MAKKKNTPEEFKLVEAKLVELGYALNNRGNYHEYTKFIGKLKCIVTFCHNDSNGETKNVTGEFFRAENYRNTNNGDFFNLTTRVTAMPPVAILTPEDVVIYDLKGVNFSKHLEHFIEGIHEMYGTNLESMAGHHSDGAPGIIVKTGLVDINNREIKIGDKIKFCYVSVTGQCNPDCFSDLEYTVAFEQGCVVGVRPERNAKVLRGYMKTVGGKYISNYGNLVEYPDNVVYCKVID